MDDINISVFNLSTYFSNWKSAKYLSLYVDVTDSNGIIKTYGPFKSREHLCGLNWMRNYILRFFYDGLEPMRFALIFAKNFDSTNEHKKFSEFQFPIFSKFKTQKDLNDFGEFIYPDTIKLSYIAIIMPFATLFFVLLIAFSCHMRCCCCI